MIVCKLSDKDAVDYTHLLVGKLNRIITKDDFNEEESNQYA